MVRELPLPTAEAHFLICGSVMEILGEEGRGRGRGRGREEGEASRPNPAVLQSKEEPIQR